MCLHLLATGVAINAKLIVKTYKDPWCVWSGSTALTLAALGGHSDLCRDLILNGAKVKLTNEVMLRH